jgi:hypothetical protein
MADLSALSGIVATGRKPSPADESIRVALYDSLP